MTADLKAREVPSGRAAAKVAREIRQAIASGRLKAGDFLPSLRDMGTRHRIGFNAARNAVKALEREGLVVARPRHGYQVAAAARGSSGLSGAYLLSGPPRDRAAWPTLYAAMLLELQSVAASRGLSLLTVGCDEKPSEEMVEMVRGARAIGALLERPNPAFEELTLKAGVVTVRIEDYSPDAEVDSIAQDNYGGAMRATRHLTDKGHRRIAWVGPQPGSEGWSVGERFGGFLSGLRRAGLRPDPELVFEARTEGKDYAAEGLGGLLSGADRPTAVVALWAGLAQAVAGAAAELGMKLGADLDLVGWCREDEYETSYAPGFAGGVVPPTMVWSVREMVEVADAQIEERRARPELPVIARKIPVRMRAGRSAAGGNR